MNLILEGKTISYPNFDLIERTINKIMPLYEINLGGTLITHRLFYQNFPSVLRCVFSNYGLSFFVFDNILNVAIKAI